MKKLILAAAMIIAAMMPAAADLPFRLHRYDAFKATPTGNSSIVFMGQFDHKYARVARSFRQ